MMTSDKLVKSTSAGFRPQQVPQQVSTRNVIHRAIHKTQSVPITSVEKELPTFAGRSAMRPDSSMSKDAADSLDIASPRSSDIRRRPRRIDLGLPHSAKPTSRVAAAGSGAADSTLSAADSGSVPRPTQSGSLSRCAAVAAAVQETIPTNNVGERSRLGSGDVKQRVGWSHDSSDGLSATRSRNQRQTSDSVDSQPLRGPDENGDSPAMRRGSPATQNAAGRSRPPMVQRQLTFTQQRPPPTMTRPSTTPKSARTTGAMAMTKSVSHPSFLAMLVSGTAVAGRDAGPSECSRGHVAARTPNTRRGDNNVESTANSEEENNNDDDDDDDEEDEMKRQRIEHWLQHLETVVLDRPSSPIIDEDVPPQTDTAIHIIYDGD